GRVPDSAAPPGTEPGLGSVAVEALRRGLQANFGAAAGRPTAAVDPSDPIAHTINEPYDFSLGLPNFKKIIGKTFYGLGESAPEAAGAIGGAALGTALSPETPGLSQVLGAGTGAAVVHAAKVLSPLYAAELQKTPDDSDAAFARAIGKAGQD